MFFSFFLGELLKTKEVILKLEGIKYIYRTKAVGRKISKHFREIKIAHGLRLQF